MKEFLVLLDHALAHCEMTRMLGLVMVFLPLMPLHKLSAFSCVPPPITAIPLLPPLISQAPLKRWHVCMHTRAHAHTHDFTSRTSPYPAAEAHPQC